MKKNFKKFFVSFQIIVLLALIFLSIPSLVYGESFQELIESSPEVNSYEIFYPVVAGILPTNKKYLLKVIRDELDILLMKDIASKANKYVEISNKKILEAEQLMLSQNTDLALKSLRKSAAYLNKALKLASKVEEEEQIISISTTILDASKKQQKFLPSLAKEFPQISQEAEVNYNLSLASEEISNKLVYKFLHEVK